MDDQRFDDSIKNKLGDYEDPTYDPSALAAMHHHLAASITIPWYDRNRNELLFGSGVAFLTCVILFSQWYWTQNSLPDEMQNSNALVSELNQLRNDLDQIKNIQHDTIRISEVRYQTNVMSKQLEYELAMLTNEIEKLKNQNAELSRYTMSRNFIDTTFSIKPLQQNLALSFRQPSSVAIH